MGALACLPEIHWKPLKYGCLYNPDMQWWSHGVCNRGVPLYIKHLGCYPVVIISVTIDLVQLGLDIAKHKSNFNSQTFWLLSSGHHQWFSDDNCWIAVETFWNLVCVLLKNLSLKMLFDVCMARVCVCMNCVRMLRLCVLYACSILSAHEPSLNTVVSCDVNVLCACAVCMCCVHPCMCMCCVHVLCACAVCMCCVHVLCAGAVCRCCVHVLCACAVNVLCACLHVHVLYRFCVKSVHYHCNNKSSHTQGCVHMHTRTITEPHLPD